MDESSAASNNHRMERRTRMEASLIYRAGRPLKNRYKRTRLF